MEKFYQSVPQGTVNVSPGKAQNWGTRASAVPVGREEVEKQEPPPVWKPEGMAWGAWLGAPKTRI